MFSHKYKFLFIAFLAIYSFLNIVILEGDRLFQAELPKDYLFYTILFLSALVWLSNLAIQKWITTKVLKPYPLVIQFLLSLVAVIIICLISVELTVLILGGPFEFTTQNLLLTSAFAFRINLFLNSINAIYYFSKKYKEKAVEAEKLKTLTSTARYEMLNNQINPHFFFNNLNTLSTLIHADTEKADQYLQKLSEIYRYILSNKDSELVSLSQELKFLNDYIELLSIRFQDSLSFQLNIDKESYNKFLPPAVLQLLVENVVKHNYFTKQEPLIVTIKSKDHKITILNKIQKKDALEHSNGIGLKNISERYEFLGENINIRNQSDIFEVELPLIQM